MTQSLADTDLAAAPAERPEPDLSQLKARVVAYLKQLGLTDTVTLESLTDECLLRAGRRVAPGDLDELLRRALEEAQRRFDQAVARALGPGSSKDVRLVAGARAAVLLHGIDGIDGNALMLFHEGRETEFATELVASLPQATPPEASVPMHEQPISFFFSRAKKP